VNTLRCYWDIVQRLFSTFADGWPGAGILLLRLLAGAALIGVGIGDIRNGAPPLTLALQVMSIAAATLLFVGMLTPVAGVLAAAVKVWISISQFSSRAGDPWITLAQAVLAAALAMIGPGAWSIDARLFGRKRIDLTKR
jgi:putative oxidoreductase